MNEESSLLALERRMIGHGAAVVVVGLVAGFGLLFALLEQIAIWPIPALDVQLPGSVRGWQSAHVGGLLNGVMVVAFALTLRRLQLAERTARWVALGFIYTAWANTVFYWFGNFAPNRGLSGGDTVHGEATAAGLIAYLPAATATVVTIACALAVTRAAFAAR
ncbi:MAG: hypothetical protein AAF690_24135 [Acidobacteriota bacterium]